MYEKNKKLITLNDLKGGERGIIKKLKGSTDFNRRLLEMGFTRGSEVIVYKEAPLKDPVEYIIKGYHISLRREEAERIVMVSEPDLSSPDDLINRDS